MGSRGTPSSNPATSATPRVTTRTQIASTRSLTPHECGNLSSVLRQPSLIVALLYSEGLAFANDCDNRFPLRHNVAFPIAATGIHTPGSSTRTSRDSTSISFPRLELLALRRSSSRLL